MTEAHQDAVCRRHGCLTDSGANKRSASSLVQASLKAGGTTEPNGVFVPDEAAVFCCAKFRLPHAWEVVGSTGFEERMVVDHISRLPITEEERRLARSTTRRVSGACHIETTDGLEDWRTRYLGRERGELSAVLKGLGGCPPSSARPSARRRIEVKAELDDCLRRDAGVARVGASSRAGA